MPSKHARRMIEVAKGDDTMRMKTVMALAVAALTVRAGAAIGQTKLDPDLAHYKTVSGVSGNVSSVGSDTLNNLMTHWAESFQKFYPNAKVQIEGKGSSTAPPALISGTAQLGPMSREMKGTEIDAFEKKYGYKPTPIRTSVDALAVFVNKDNPITCLSIVQVDAIFSKSRRQGAKDDLRTWGQLGLLSPGGLSLRLRQQGARQAARPADPRVRQAHRFARGAGGCRQGRLLPDPRDHREGRAEQDPVAWRSTPTLSPRAGRGLRPARSSSAGRAPADGSSSIASPPARSCSAAS